MKMSNTCIILILVAITGVQLVCGQCDCANQPDGYVCTVGCKELRRCFNSEEVVIVCGDFEVIDFENARCVPEADAPAPCGTVSDRNCTGKADGYYPEYESGCTTYYSCNNGQFAYRQFCPDGLVFNVNNGVCDWPYNVCPPCGTGENVGLCPTDPSPCNCTNATPGTECYSDCQVLIICAENGESNTLVCEAGTVVDITTRTCRPRAEVPPPCGTASPSTAIPATTPPAAPTSTKTTTTTTEAPTTPESTTQPPPPPTTTTTTSAPITTTSQRPSLCDDCANAPSGTKCFINCKEYHECLAGLLIRVTCDTNLVVDPVTLECAIISEVCPPCGTRDNCGSQVPSTVAARQVPSTVVASPCDDCPNQTDGIRCFRDCNYYMTCSNGQPLRVSCDTNDDMVVNPRTVRCEDIEDVCPPCGSNDYEDECPPIHENDFDINNLTGGQD